MSTKKKAIVKADQPKPRYTNGTRVFICNYAFAGPGLILEGEVTRVDTIQHPLISENGKITGTETMFSYIIYTAKGTFEETQLRVYPNYTEAAKEFGNLFTQLLK